MPPVKDALKHLYVEEAARSRRCHRDRSHSIAAGEKSLGVYEEGSRRNYCLSCAPAVLDAAEAKISRLRADLK